MIGAALAPAEAQPGEAAAIYAVEVSDLRAQYDRTQRPALDGVSLGARSGARIALVGPNGAGKSTLLRAVVGLVPIVAGTIRIHGVGLAQCRQKVAYLPQVTELDWRFPVTVGRLVETGRYVHLGWLRRPDGHDRWLARQAMERLSIEGLAERQIGQLSGGQRQRALLARALAQQADVLLLDEPFAAVDAESRRVLMDVLDGLRSDGTTVLLATHDLDHLHIDTDEIVRLDDGHAVTPGA